MEKMKFETVDGTRRTIDKIAEMFPQVITEVLGDDGKLKRAVKWDILKELLSGDYVEGGECYEFTWPGKRAAIAEAAKPIRKTLRPCKEESKNWDTTENLYIEGDNLEVLKLLQESYLGKVKMIYIDPPYNTGSDFVYKDNFSKDQATSEDELGLFDEETDNRTMSGDLFKNTESNGRFHSDWCSMMYPRLQIAGNLLSDDGVIFISIDNSELENLKMICNEIFNHDNTEIYIWDTREAGTLPKTAKNTVRRDNEFIISVFKKNKKLSKYSEKKYLDKADTWNNPDNDPRGPWMSANISRSSGEATGGSKSFTIINPAGVSFYRDWSVSEEEYNQLLKDNRIFFADNGNGVPRKKIFASDVVESIQSSIFENLKSATSAGQILAALMEGKYFDYPKPLELVSRLIQIGSSSQDIILDFFSGSATTAHAVMQLNTEDGGNRKFVMVQLPEVCEAGSEAAKAGYKNICEIGKERIRRAGEKIKEEAGLAAADLDIGFRVFKVADSNMKDVYYSASDYSQDMLDSLVSNIKEDRTDLDLLYGCLLEWGVELSLPHTSETIDNVTVHTVNNGDLIACFDANIPESAIRTIAKRQPLRAVFRDSSFASAPQKINVEEIFKLLSPTTTVKVI